MDAVTLEELKRAAGVDVVDVEGERIGAVEDVYYDDASGRPEWIGIGTGVFGTRRRVVPADGARVVGPQVMVSYHRDAVRDSPAVDDDAISGEQVEAIRAHYRLGARSVTPDDAESPVEADWQRSGEDPTIGVRDVDDEGRLHIRRWVPDDTDAGRIGGDEVH